MTPLAELEAVFLARSKAAGAKQVLVTMNLDEDAIRALKPRLETAGMSLSEFVRASINLRVHGMAQQGVAA